MFEKLLTDIAALGSTEVQNIICTAGESLIKTCKESNAWINLIVGTGDFFIKHEKEENSFFKDLELVLSRENLCQVAKDLKTEDGYDLKNKLYNSFMQLMRNYEIPREYAESYTLRIIYAILEQLRIVKPEKYEHYFLQEWKEEQEKSYLELQNRIDKMAKELVLYNRENVAIESAGSIDVYLRKSTWSPSIGIDFFIVDDEHFQNEFEDLRYDELVFIKGRNREETIYYILNELWRLNDNRPVYVVKSLESWNKLRNMDNKGNVYIPWFYADEIVAINNNTNIFVINENTPTFGKKFLELRPRTRRTLSECLHKAGLDYKQIELLIEDTHGLYSQMKKKMFKGELLKNPSWMTGMSEKAKKTCLLVGSWEEIEGDKLIIEHIYGGTYDTFIGEILPFITKEDPLLYTVKRNGNITYYLSSAENIWSYLNVLTSEKIWQSYEDAVLLVVNESENLFCYDTQERLHAQFNGEKLNWSETIRIGLLGTMLIKGAYYNDEDTQFVLNKLVTKILECVKTEKQWIYISRFWTELCEISPKAVLERIEQELINNTGLLSLFQNQSSDIFLGRNFYVNILWGIEQFLVQKEYFWSAFRWLLQLDAKDFEYKSNSTSDIFSKVFCSWQNFSALQTAEEKIKAAKLSLQIDSHNIWNYLYSSIDHNGRYIMGELSSPKYREFSKTRSTTVSEMRKTETAYYNLLMKHMERSVERWKKMLEISVYLSDELLNAFLKQLSFELSQMNDVDVMTMKNEIRHLIYKHRYFASSDWSVSEERILEYERYLNGIKLYIPEYEYFYLFSNSHEYPLLNPIPYDEEEKREKNDEAKEILIREKLLEFREKGYNLTKLAILCAKEPYSSLGSYLAKYWNDGKWDDSIFNCLLVAQESGILALNYLDNCKKEGSVSYRDLIENLSDKGYSIEIIAKLYRMEALETKNIPLVHTASEKIKKEFWKNYIHCEEVNELWALTECKKYATLNVYLDQMYQIHYRNPLSAEKIFKYFDGIENLEYSDSNSLTSYHLEQLITIIQETYIDDEEKCLIISHFEIHFMNLLEWENMKCFRKMIKQSPELFAQIVEVVFKKDHDGKTEKEINQNYIHYMYTIYEKAQFCPAEANEKIDENELEQWIKKYKHLLSENDQESLFTCTLGRLFAFSPVGADGHEPCEAVRRMIEKYGDNKMQSRYQTAVYNRRGVFTPSAGKEEQIIAEDFKKNALYLQPDYPKTAEIFFGLYETYKMESERARMDAENGWY